MARNDLTSVGLLAVLAITSIFVYRLFPLAPAPASVTPARRRQEVSGDKNYRIRGVPLVWEKEQLQSFLTMHRDCHDPVVKSLAIEAHGRSKTGTVTFRDGTDPPKTLQGSLQPDEKSQTLVLDHGFLGLTTLFAPLPEDHQVDIVAISGLGGHAFGSFREPKGQHMWLRDALPYHLLWEHSDRPMARVITYGYESEVANSRCMQNLEDLATTFRDGLNTLTSSRRARPLILVAHSLGGLIVKQAIITLANSKADDHQKLLQAVYGVVFFGVPHDGMDISSLIPMVGNGLNRELVGSLGRINPQILIMQQRDFHKALGPEGHTEVFCFYETEASHTAKQGEDGTWRMNGDMAILVTKSSATHCRPWEDGAENICAIKRSHSGMVKFGAEDHDYEWAVRGKLEGLAQRALTVRSRVRAENTKFLVPYNQNQSYIGRPIIDTIKERFGYSKSQATRHSRVSLFGLGGIGKTQIALAFSYWIRDNYSDVSVFWVHASSADRFFQAFTSIAEECRLPGRDDPKSNVPMLVRRWLERKERGRWIMVIDNADDMELFFPSESGKANTPKDTSTESSSRLSDYLPDCTHGSILITTKDKKVAIRLSQGKLPVEIDKMNQNETEQLLEKTLGKEASPEEAASLSARLEYLPLALVQAAAFIQENSVSISNYLQLLDQNDETLVNLLSEPFETVGRDSDVPNGVAATWIVSFNQIQQNDILAGQILSFLSLLDRQAIPQKFIVHFCDQKHDRLQQPGMSEVTKALGTLKAFSFVTQSKGNTIDMHRLVQLVTRKWLIMKDKYAQYSEHSMDVVSTLFPYGRHETRQDCMDYLPHALSVLRNEGTRSHAENTARASLLYCMANYFFYRGEWSEAESSARQSGKLRKEVLGEEHPDTLTSMASLASTYTEQGRWKEAEELEVRVMEMRKRVLGEEHPDTLTSMANLASTYKYQGRWKESDQLQVKELSICSRLLGEEHPSTMISMANLASLYTEQGRWKEAEELEVRVMEMRKRVLGEEHPDTLTSMANLAATFWNQGRWKEAEELGVRVMEMSLRVLGEDHPDTLTSMHNLAFTWKDLERWGDAMQLLQDCVRRREILLGVDHPDAMSSASSLSDWILEFGGSSHGFP